MATQVRCVEDASASAVTEMQRRMAAIASYAVLDTPPEIAFDDLARLASAICEAPMAAISLVCDERQWFKAKVGLDVSETHICQSFCAHAIKADGLGLFEIRDAECDPRFAANPLVTGQPNIRFYAGMPLINPHGVPIGALCVIDDLARPDGLSEIQRQALDTLTNQVMLQLELRRTIAQRDRFAAEQMSTAEELRWLVRHDPLTRLANRTLFQERLQAAVERASPHDRAALVSIDLDYFKQVNDSLGHDAGDDLLRAFAARLTAWAGPDDTVARLGGDEFAIILTGLGAERDAVAMIDELMASFVPPHCHHDREIECRATIGAALYPDDAADLNALVRHADIALYAAKASGRGRAVFFDAEMLEESERHAGMLQAARTALDNGWITPFYQPLVDLSSGRINGFEALMRWRRPGGALQLPASLAAAFEDRELASRLGAAMIGRVAADMRRWLDAGVPFGRVAVNAAAAEFHERGFAARMLAALENAGVPAEHLEVEITETVLLDRKAEIVRQELTQLATAGVRVALDDFGTGYASLSHLQRFPFHVIKIDQSFVRGVHGVAGDRAIVNALLSLGRNLDMDIVAEGIESEAQASYLRDNGCPTGQGFLFGAAMAAEFVPSAIRRRSTLSGEIAGRAASDEGDRAFPRSRAA